MGKINPTLAMLIVAILLVFGMTLFAAWLIPNLPLEKLGAGEIITGIFALARFEGGSSVAAAPPAAVAPQPPAAAEAEHG